MNTAQVKLWTIQRASSARSLNKVGAIRCSSLVVDPYFLSAYLWMTDHLRLTVGQPPVGVEWPIWAWRHWRGSLRSKPDLRSACFAPSGTACIRVEFEISLDKILLSNFDGWHAVLNNHQFQCGEIDCKEIDSLGATKSNTDNWCKIFDLDLIEDPGSSSVQAVLWEVRAEWITEIKSFTAR